MGSPGVSGEGCCFSAHCALEPGLIEGLEPRPPGPSTPPIRMHPALRDVEVVMMRGSGGLPSKAYPGSPAVRTAPAVRWQGRQS